ncbi:MAG: transposase [Clostridia bacterium]|nr:transposase [Clostridia bacterium]
MDVSSQKCMGCGATLKYSPEKENWTCEYCGASYTIKDMEEFQAKSKQSIEKQNENSISNEGMKIDKELDSYTCKNCGAELVTDGTTAATTCVYCKSTAVIKNRVSGIYLPSKLIPFTKTKQDAINAFKSCTKGKIFAPNAFSNMKNLQEVSGVYVPFWLYDSKVNVDYEARGTKVTSWTSGDTHYTKTDVYNIERKGNMEFEKVPADSSSKFEDDLMDSIEPYNFNDLKDFNEAYLSGFLAEKFDVTKEEASKRMEQRVANTAIEEARKTAIGYSSVTPHLQNVQIEKGNISYVMLPVWMLNIKFANKIYHFAMNGTTGKFIGEIPIDKRKAWGYTLAFLAVCIAIGCAFSVLV